MDSLFIGEVFRYARPYSSNVDKLDGYRNHFYVTKFGSSSLVLLEKGINQIGVVRAIDGPRTPAVLIRSSPHKIGSSDTPWHDIFDVNNGHIRYYGDNKKPGFSPESAPGNKVLLNLHRAYNSESERIMSVPLLFYKSVSKDYKAKGYLEFNGFGIIRGVELKTQYDRKADRTFTNYAFDFHVFKLDKENELFDWSWINDRRNPDLSLEETLKKAPQSWKQWIKEGATVIEKNRRRVSSLLVYNKVQQMPVVGSAEHKILQGIYSFYNGKNHEFEMLAAFITEKILNDSSRYYRTGWITQQGSDNGADFYGRYDIGDGFGSAKLIVLGQAKCEELDKPTNGNHVARTVARLRRGWIGVYVTTSYFSDPVQKEIIEDEYPILLVSGRKVAEIVFKALYESGYADLPQFLKKIEFDYGGLINIRRPEELLLE